MATAGLGTPVRASGLDAGIWKISWSYTDGTGAPSLVTTVGAKKSDQAETVTTPAADGGVGITNLSFPKCRDAWPMGPPVFSPATVATGALHLQCVLTNWDPAAGTAKVRFLSNDGNATATDPEALSTCSLMILVERP